MEEDYKDYKLKSGNILRVIRDSDPKSPNKWDDEDIFLVYQHRQFTVEREGFRPDIINEYLNDDPNERSLEFDDYHIFPVDAYIHSGISLSLANTKNLSDRRWDVSTTGFVLVKKDILQQGSGGIEEDLTLEEARKYAEALLETWNQYLSGDVWGFELLKPYNIYHINETDLNNLVENVPYHMASENIILEKNFKELAIVEVIFEEIDSCWGFYGSDPKENEMLDNIDDELNE